MTWLANFRGVERREKIIFEGPLIALLKLILNLLLGCKRLNVISQEI